MSMEYDFDEYEWRAVGKTADWPANSARVVHIGARKIAVLNQTGGWFACKNGCPHRGLPLVNDNGQSSAVSCENDTLRCPHHGWPFDLHSGQGPEDSCLRTYPVKVEADTVYVGV